MRVLGIDPGTFRMGIGVVDGEGGDLRLVCSSVLSPKRGKPLPQRLHYMYSQLLQVIEKWEPTEVAIEEPFVALNVHAAMAVGQAQAVAMVAAASRGLPVFTYSPREVKQAVADYGGSSKEQVQEMVRLLLGLDELPAPSDAADALAVAICHVNASHAKELEVRD
jgi:crossover junction endodeoxyribonuclease RuvC